MSEEDKPRKPPAPTPEPKRERAPDKQDPLRKADPTPVIRDKIHLIKPVFYRFDYC